MPDEVGEQRLLVPIDEAAYRLGVHRTTTYELVKQGKLKHVRIGRRGLIVASSIDRYVEELTEGAAGGAA